MVLVVWGEVHPRRHVPVLQLGDGRELTPAEISRAASDPESWVAGLLRRAFAASQLDDEISPAEPLDEILLDFELDLSEWRLGELGA